jgi:hypothetical protein
MKIDGKSMRVRIVGKGTIALATSCQLQVNTQMTDSRTKDDAKGPSQDFESVDWNVSSDNMVGYNEKVTSQVLFSQLLDSQIVGEKFELCVDLVANSSGAVPENDWQSDAEANKAYAPYGGLVLIESISLNAPNDGKSSFSVSFKGVGPLKKMTTTQASA